MPETLSDQHVREIASAPRELWWGFPAAERVSQHIARSEGYAESSAVGWGPGVYALFEEMEDKDAHLFSILQTRKYGAFSRSRRLVPASGSERDREIADWLGKTLDNLPSWDSTLLALLDSLAKGMAVVEIVWGYDAGGRIVPVELKPRAAGRFVIGPQGELMLGDRLAAGSGAVEQTGAAGDSNRSRRGSRPFAPHAASGSASGLGRRLPARKFMTMFFGATDERPYGKGLLERVYWYWWFNKNNLKFWVLYNEKFGSPTVVAQHGAGLSEVERDRLLEVITSLQADAGVTLPEGITLDLLESNRRGSAETYLSLANWCNDEMSRAVLGQTLTVGEGRRSGSLALGRVHEAVRFDYIKTDACLLMDAINSQLIRWAIDFNFGEKFPAPRWTIDLSPEIDAETEAKIDQQLLQMGVPLPLRYFHDKYGRPAAAPGERQLRYDDQNLYQYHLQFGVLTVNEVRASLGLSPVAWGDQPPSPAGASSPPSTPARAPGDASPLGGDGLGRAPEGAGETENEDEER